MFKFSWAERFLLTGIFLLTLIFPAHAINVVNNNSDGEGSLKWAIEHAEAGGEIIISSDLKTVHLSQELTFTRSAKISGSGTLIDGEETRRLFRVTNGRVIFEGLVFTRGNAIAGSGGAVEVDGSGASAEFRNCIFYDNSARDYGGAVCVTKGDNTNPTILKHCTITANTSANGGGVAVLNGQLQSLSSIIVGNTSSYDIYANGTGILSSRYSIAGTSNATMDITDKAGQDVSQVLVIDTLNERPATRITKSSPAFNYVTDSQYSLSNDIAGTTRPQFGAYDSGAYEISAVALRSADINGVPYVKIGDSVLFSLDITPSNADLNSKDHAPAGIVWHSSSADIITVSTTGSVKAIKAGVADVWAEVHGWNSQGQNFSAASRRITVHAGDEAFTELRAEIVSIDNRSMYMGETLDIKPDIHTVIDRYELDESDGVSYVLSAKSSRPEIVSADVISGDTVRLKAGHITGVSDITLETLTIPEGRTVTQSFTVGVVSNYTPPEPDSNDKGNNGVRGTSQSGGGCNSGMMVIGGIIAAMFIRKEKV